MRILIVNDDGINAKGIATIATALKDKHDITVIAPDIECSGESHRLSFIRPIAFKEVVAIKGCKCYKIHGSPADCAKFGIGLILDEKPDLLISGINNGENIGTDLIYSGTVNAAIEATYSGVKAIALSVSSRHNDFDHCAKFLVKNLDKILAMIEDTRTVININFPCDTAENIKGVKVCPVGSRVFHDEYQSIPRRYVEYENCYMLTGSPILSDHSLPPSDVQMWEKGYITISPIKVDFNDYAALAKVKDMQFDI